MPGVACLEVISWLTSSVVPAILKLIGSEQDITVISVISVRIYSDSRAPEPLSRFIHTSVASVTL